MKRILTGVSMGDSRGAGCVPQVKNMTGVLHGHHFHSTVTDLQTPVYSSAPKRARTAVWALRGPRPGPLDDGGLLHRWILTSGVVNGNMKLPIPSGGDFIRRYSNRQSKRRELPPVHGPR